MNVYRFNVVCRCPVDGKPDSYAVTVRSRRTVMTDIIGKAVARLAAQKIPQEQFTNDLARALQAEVTTEGDHPAYVSQAVCSAIRATCTAGDA